MKLEIIGCKAIFIPEHDYDLFELGKIAKSIITYNIVTDVSGELNDTIKIKSMDVRVEDLLEFILKKVEIL